MAKQTLNNGETGLVHRGKINDNFTEVYDGLDAKMPKSGGTFTGDIVVPAEAYGIGWDGSNEAPTKNDIYDKIESIGASSGDMTKAVYDPQNIEADAFDVDNHTSGTTNKVFTATEKTKLANLSTVATSGDYNDLSNKPDLSVYDEVEQYANLASFPGTGNSTKFYLAQDTGIMYRWTGSGYDVISGQLALGETSSTAYRGDRGKTAYDHSQLTSGNPHNVTKSDIGLGSVENTAISTYTGFDDRYYTETETDGLLDDKLNIVLTNIASTDINTLVTPGRYCLQTSCTNLPESGVKTMLEVCNDPTTTSQVMQVAKTATSVQYIRVSTNSGSTWSSWTTPSGGSYTDEEAQDAVGGILTDTDDIDLAYNDATPNITASLKSTAISAKTSATLTGTEEVLVNQGGTLKKTTTQDIADLGGGGATSPTLLYGESVSARDLVGVTTYPKSSEGATALLIGADSTQEKVSSVIFGDGTTITQIPLYLYKTGSPTDNLTVRIETDNAGFPSGTLVDANATASVAGTSLSTSTPSTQTTLSFAGSFSLTDKVKYHLVLGRSGAVSSANYYRTFYSTAPQGIFKLNVLNSSTWTTINGTLRVENFSGIYKILVGKYHTNYTLMRVLGFVKNNASAFDAVDIAMPGSIIGGFSGLTPRTPYFPTTTAGVVGTSTNSPKVAEAVNETEMMVIFQYSSISS